MRILYPNITSHAVCHAYVLRVLVASSGTETMSTDIIERAVLRKHAHDSAK